MIEGEGAGLLQRIEQRLAALGMTERAASVRAFGHGSAIKNLRTGGSASPRLDTISKLAGALETTPEWLAYGIGSPDAKDAFGAAGMPSVPVLGEVAAGTWREVDSAVDQPPSDPVPVPPDPRWPYAEQFALVVRGSSIDRIAQDGDILSCVSLRAIGREPEDGELVVVERTRFGGQMRETTAKILRRAGARVELWPESNDPKFQEPIVLDPDGDDREGETVEIRALVTWVHAPLERRRPSRRAPSVRK